MGKSNIGGSEKDRKTKEKNKAFSKEKPSLKDEELIKSMNLNDNQWQCSVALVVVSNQRLNEKLLTELSGQQDVFVITEQDLSVPARKKSKSKKGSRSRSKSIGSGKSSSKSKKTTTKTNKTGKLSESRKTPKPSQIEEQPCSKTCFSLKKIIIDKKELDIKENRINERLGNNNQQFDNIQINDENCGLNNNENRVDNDYNPFHRFIILSGFYDPKIPAELAKFMIPLKALIHITEPYNPPKLSVDMNGTKVGSKTKDSGGKKVKPVSNKVNSECIHFVNEMSDNINNEDYLEIIRDCIFINFTANNDNSNFKANIMKVFHTIRDAWIMYEQYQKGIKNQEIPLINEILDLGCAELYNTMISLVPLECVNIPVMIHCMVEQVVWWVDNRSPSEVSHADSVHKTGELQQTSYETLLRYLITKNVTPVIANERDEIKLNTFHLHLPEFKIEDISTKMYKRSPIYRLWEIYPAQTLSNSTWFKFHLQKLKSCNNKSYFNQDNIYLHHLHQVLMNLMILNMDSITEANNDHVNQPLEEHKSNGFDFYLKKPVDDKHSSIFIGLLLNDLLHEIFQKRSMLSRSHSPIAFNKGLLSTQVEDREFREQSIQHKWYDKNISNNISAKEPLLQKKARHKTEKLNRLKAFLLCDEFVGLYEEILNLENEISLYDCLCSYEYIEELDCNIMSQSLQSAYLNHTNVNYEYFAPTDTLLLWFNNVIGNKLISKENINLFIETSLGFRDFYTLKLNGKINLNETTHSNNDVNTADVLTDAMDYDTFLMNKNYNRKSTTVYELGAARSKVSESVVQFDSPDSSNVLIKKWSYFDKRKCNFSVAMTKNNTTIIYEVNPENDSLHANISMTFYNGILANSSLTWKPPGNIYSTESTNSKRPEKITISDAKTPDGSYELESHLSITLPSGLFIEIVPTDGELGPFYVKQRYLSKGPTCSKIWDEAYRCYLKNGTIMVFRNDSSVDILYSNGAKVTCTGFEEFEKIIGISEEPKTNNDIPKSQIDSSKKTKGGTSKNAKKKGKKTSFTKEKQQKSEEELIVDENSLLKEQIRTIPALKITEHSVLCPKGERINFKNNEQIMKENMHTLSMGFDEINHELHLRRSDSQTYLFSEELLSVLFQDGSKITSYTKDDKELIMDDFTVITAQERNSINYKNKQLSDQTHINFMPDQEQGKDLSENSSLYESDLENFVMVVSSYVLEHNNYATVKFLNDEDVTEICLPGQITIRIDMNNLFTVTTEDNDTICLNEDNNLCFQASVLQHSLRPSRSIIQFVNVDNYMRITSQTVDSYGNKFSIDDRGNANLIRIERRCDKFESRLGPPHHPQVSNRFFIFRRDFTGFEMIHKNQTMSNYFAAHKADKDVIKIPIIKDNGELFTFYTQKSIYNNKSEGYLMSYINEQNQPYIIKEKDQRKREYMPETIWFDMAGQIIAPGCSASLAEAVIAPKVIVITEKTKIKIIEYDLVSTFTTSLKTYINKAKNLYKQYEEHYDADNRKEEIYAEGERLKETLFGSKSYHLVDNLPTVEVGEGANNQCKPEITIRDILSSYEIT